jgi:GNAT superfamily N-acetyltransferase
VRRSWRGKGVAGAIKRAQIGLAMQKGFGRMLTGNEVTNAPIRHLNERLGYKPKVTTVFLRGPVG